MWLNAAPGPHSRALYLAEIDRLFPERNKYEEYAKTLKNYHDQRSLQEEQSK